MKRTRAASALKERPAKRARAPAKSVEASEAPAAPAEPTEPAEPAPAPAEAATETTTATAVAVETLDEAWARVMGRVGALGEEKRAKGAQTVQKALSSKKNLRDPAWILSSAGVAYRLPESALNAVTGLSGSGPAYVAYLVREFAKAGEAVGLPAEVSYGLALQTFYGTSRLLQQKKMSPDDLIKMVTSPKGTTYAGRQILEYSAVAQVLLDTVKAGTDRSAELGAAAAIRPKL
eukprot:m51a1_g4254 putative pyrroline-5-carboxylate reductase (234) ;mRNA; f:212744-214520